MLNSEIYIWQFRTVTCSTCNRYASRQPGADDVLHKLQQVFPAGLLQNKASFSEQAGNTSAVLDSLAGLSVLHADSITSIQCCDLSQSSETIRVSFETRSSIQRCTGSASCKSASLTECISAYCTLSNTAAWGVICKQLLMSCHRHA